VRVAVVGAGVSGLTAAYLLNRQHEVQLFERNDRAGGHANTVIVPGIDGTEVPLDVGFIVYNERTYPGFTRLLRELDVETQQSEMSFSVSCESSQIPSHRVASLLNGTELFPTVTVTVGVVVFFRKIAASVFPWSNDTPLRVAQLMDAAAAPDNLAATASSSLPSAHHPMSSTKDSPLIPGGRSKRGDETTHSQPWPRC